MNKPFRSINQQIGILNRRGVITDENTAQILMREGYYAVVNGYGKAFLNTGESRRSGDDQFIKGTTFNQIYQLYLFDRKLRSNTFSAIMCVESTLRSILAYTFTEQHRKASAYLWRSSYTPENEYIRGRQAHKGDLTWMIDTLEHHARGHVEDEHEDVRPNERVDWYRTHYEAVPLWVLFSDLTFGNLRYFFALMKRDEQKSVCNRMRSTCGTTHDGKTLAPLGMYHDLEALSELRNACAHVERIYNGRFGTNPVMDFHQISKTLMAYLAEDDEQEFLQSVQDLVDEYATSDDGVARALALEGFVPAN